MRYKLLLTILAALLSAQYGRAQQALDSAALASMPMTKVQRQMLNITDLNDLQAAYDTIKTNYDQRNFINALPGYFKINHIQTIPAWVKGVVITALASKDPLLVNESVRTAGMLNISCSTELMALYKTIHTTYGCHENMLKSAILTSLVPMSDANKQQFYYGLLTNESFPVLSASFSSLLYALESAPSVIYVQKLGEYADTLGSLLARFESAKEKNYFRIQQCNETIARVNKLRNSIAKDAKGGGQ